MTATPMVSILTGVLLAAGAAGGSVLGSFLAAPARDRGENANETAAALGRLAAEIRALAERPERPAESAPGAPREKTNNSFPRVTREEELVALLRRFVAAQDRPGGAGSASAGASHGGVLVVPEPMPLAQRIEVARAFRKIDDRDERGKEIFKTHRLATYQQILDRYGPPDDISCGGSGTRWEYEFQETDLDHLSFFSFTFADGFVVAADCND